MTKCKESVWLGYRSHPCGRDANAEYEGVLMCAKHAAGKRRREKTNEKHKAEFVAASRRHDEAAVRSLKLGAGRPAWDQKVGYTGGVVLTPEEADAMIERLAKANGLTEGES